MSKLFSAQRYTKEHETVTFDDSTGLGTIAITDHAQNALGDVVFVELPAVGTEVAKGGEFRRECITPTSVHEHPEFRFNWSSGECKSCVRYSECHIVLL